MTNRFQLNSAEQQNRLGEDLFARGEYQAALEAFRKALRSDPSSAMAFNNLGTVLWQQDRTPEALEAFRQALKLNPSDRLIVLNSIDVMMAMGKTCEAVGLLERYLQKNPTDKEANLHWVRAKQGGNCPGIPGKLPHDQVSRPHKSAKDVQRLLLVVDYATQPYCIGDLIVYMAAAEALRVMCGAQKTDICMISDPAIEPADENIRSMVTPQNRYHHLLEVMPVVQTTPHIGSLFVFDSLKSAQQHIDHCQTMYSVWPRVEDLGARKYLYYDAIHQLRDFHNAHGRVPELSFCDRLKNWYDEFIHQFIGDRLPVSVNLRNNGNFHDHRNSMMDEWQGFFEYCRSRYPVTFILTSSAEEVDPRFRSCPNVIIAKDHQTTLMQDLALIRFSALHMGASSGPAAIPLLSAKPYLIVNCDMLPHLHAYKGAVIKESDQRLRFAFSCPLQTFSIGKETQGFLIEEFEKMYSSVRGRNKHPLPHPNSDFPQN